MAKILLVEDDNSLREIYEARLAAEGYQVLAARDGEEALAMALKERPDLIIADVMMPKVSGFDMVDILRSTPETKTTKIIMMTALSQAEDKARAEKLGANRYLVKSQVTLEDVIRECSSILADINEPKPETNKVNLPEKSTTPVPTTQKSTPTPPPAIPVATPPPSNPTPEPVKTDTSKTQPTAPAKVTPEPAKANPTPVPAPAPVPTKVNPAPPKPDLTPVPVPIKVTPEPPKADPLPVPTPKPQRTDDTPPLPAPSIKIAVASDDDTPTQDSPVVSAVPPLQEAAEELSTPVVTEESEMKDQLDEFIASNPTLSSSPETLKSAEQQKSDAQSTKVAEDAVNSLTTEPEAEPKKKAIISPAGSATTAPQVPEDSAEDTRAYVSSGKKEGESGSSLTHNKRIEPTPDSETQKSKLEDLLARESTNMADPVPPAVNSVIHPTSDAQDSNTSSQI